MSGLLKAKKYDWKDSNLALFGSDTEKEVKKASAQQEKAWKLAGKSPGLQIWKINKFKVDSLPTEDYGSFYSGDSYIILNTYKEEESNKLLYDVHFWIGKESTQDEYCTAAYKTVELDTLLDDVPVQHREVENHESCLFKSYFKSIKYMKGGADCGFRHVKPEEYKPRLFRVFGTTEGNIVSKEVRVSKTQITSDDVYILDDGTCFYQFNGKTANMHEKYKASRELADLSSKRSKSGKEVVDEEEGGEALEAFYSALERVDQAVDDEDDDDMDQQQQTNNNRMPQKLIKLSDASGELGFKQVKEGGITRKDFISNDVFLLDTNKELYVWVGKRASENEKANGLSYAHKYLRGTSHPLISVTCMKEGQESKEFKAAIAA